MTFCWITLLPLVIGCIITTPTIFYNLYLLPLTIYLI
jgi:hypothetical protein